jgi:hypothetical protein
MPTSFMFDASGGAPITCCCACTAVPQAAKTIVKDMASLKRWRIDFLPTHTARSLIAAPFVTRHT